MRKSVFAKECFLEMLRTYSQLKVTWQVRGFRKCTSCPRTFWLNHRRCFSKVIQPLVKESKQQQSYKISQCPASKNTSHVMVCLFLNSDFQLCIYLFAALRSSLLPEIFFPWKYSKTIKSPFLKFIDKTHASSLQGRLLFEILVLKLFSDHFSVFLHS